MFEFRFAQFIYSHDFNFEFDDEKETTVGGRQQKRIKKSNSHNIVERLYSEFPEYPFLRSPLISHDNIIIASVYGNDVFAK